MNRRVLATVILVVWIGMMGWLVKRELFRPRAEILADAAMSIPPGATYYKLELGGEPIGFASKSNLSFPSSFPMKPG